MNFSEPRNLMASASRKPLKLRPGAGAVFAIETDFGTSYLQLTGSYRNVKGETRPPLYFPEVLRVLPGLFKTPPDFYELTKGGELEWFRSSIGSALRSGDIAYVGMYPLPAHAVPVPIFMNHLHEGQTYSVVAEGRPELRELTAEEARRLPKLSIMPLIGVGFYFARLNGHVEKSEIAQPNCPVFFAEVPTRSAGVKARLRIQSELMMWSPNSGRRRRKAKNGY